MGKTVIKPQKLKEFEMAKVRRLRVNELAFEPVEKPDHKFVECGNCGRSVLRKKAIRRKGKWMCPSCDN